MALIIDLNGNCTQDTDEQLRDALGAHYSDEILDAGWTSVPREEPALHAIPAPETPHEPAFDADGFLERVYSSQE
ncbi:hypothetical protein GH865_09550 [Rhodocyclus tenuis]|uniref:hypothetical protein n=1 Tax=Rhodocyclus gracilis TaxID=2929842 RepID=UPI0012988E01|nr:hypothetical protein [Rhodocyclus gracilis]MRD73490.1 hypothetical protein [Rhodocyclus gracilis]